jgi:hypothetical protein
VTGRRATARTVTAERSGPDEGRGYRAAAPQPARAHGLAGAPDAPLEGLGILRRGIVHTSEPHDRLDRPDDGVVRHHHHHNHHNHHNHNRH